MGKKTNSFFVNLVEETMIQKLDFEYFKGQERLKKRFLEYLIYYKNRKEKFPNTLLIGSPGQGKTTFAEILMQEIMNYWHALPVIIDSSWDVSKIREILKVDDELIGNFFRYVVFIDEIHKLKGVEGIFDIWDNPTIIFIGATTKESLLDKAFLSRFKIVEFFQDYNKEELISILKENASDLNIGDLVFNRITECVTNVRNAISLLDQVKVLKVNHPELNDEELWKKTLSLMDLDENGLDYRQRKYLEILKEYGEIAVKNIASLLKTTEENVEEMIEPLLLRKKLITITSKGRSLRNNYEGEKI